MWIRPTTMLASTMRAGVLASGSRLVVRESMAANRSHASCAYRVALAVRTMATTTTKKPAAATSAASSKKTATKSKSKAVAQKTKKAKDAKTKKAKDAKTKKVKDAKTKLKIDLAAETRAQKKELIEQCLYTEPISLPMRPRLVFLTKELKLSQGKDLGVIHEKYNALSAEEVQAFEKIALENKVANEAAYRAWVESHTPEQLYQAEKARRRFMNRNPTLATLKGRRVNRKIKDHRRPQAPLGTYLLFLQTKRAGLPKPLTNMEDNKAWIAKTANEYQNLAESELKVYQDMAAAQAATYNQFVGRDTPSKE